MEIDYLNIPEDKEKSKSVKIDKDVWKALSRFKLDCDKPTFNEAIKKLLENEGY